MLYKNNSSGVNYVHECIIYSHFEASISNKETTNVFYFELYGSFNLVNMQTIAYVLPTCTYCKHYGARKLYREIKGFYCFDGKVKLFMPNSPDELYALFMSKEHACMKFKKFTCG